MDAHVPSRVLIIDFIVVHARTFIGEILPPLLFALYAAPGELSLSKRRCFFMLYRCVIGE